jgi:2-polyprenyl-6-methoxyphenol hydroxylase-like FAD-dependent oxidoreductase
MATPPPSSCVDALIVGARPAGAATALLLARAGWRTLLVDAGRRGADTLSTHALMRGGVLQLARWGLAGAVQEAGTPVIRRTSFHYGEAEVAVAIKPRAGVEGLLAPRRTVLDAVLVDAARDAGAEVRHGCRLVELVRRGDGRVAGAVLEEPGRGRWPVVADWVVGADGAGSRVATLVGAPNEAVAERSSGMIYGYWRGLGEAFAEAYRWYYRPGVAAGAIATNDDLTCLFVATTASRFASELRPDLVAGYHRLLGEAAPAVAAAVTRAERVGSFRGYAGRPGFLRRAWGPGWALVGDAGYFRDPITAHGITDALRDAELLARALEDGAPEALATYQRTRDDLSHELFALTDRIAGYDWDLATLEGWHRELAAAMGEEVRYLGALDAVAA